MVVEEAQETGLVGRARAAARFARLGDVDVAVAGYPVMSADYSDDGGHIYGEGSLRVARAFWTLLVRVAGEE